MGDLDSGTDGFTQLRKLSPVPFDRVSVEGAFWDERMRVNREQTLQAEYRMLKETGRIDAFALDWKPGMEPRPHQFWDSDVAKWVEAASYSLATHPDAELERLLDEVVSAIVAAQQSDGYLNVYFTVVEPENRWKNLRDMHELYCAGHLMEAAVAHFQATGKRTLLDAMTRCADYIDSVFGDASGKRYGAPGHEEIELALVKLYRVTGERRYLRLSEFFLEQRGRKPSVFHLERPDEPPCPTSSVQDHLPVREQQDAVGHAVRAMYLYCGMADVASETEDEQLLHACERLWDSTTLRRMYITGGVGSTSVGECFTEDYDLPNSTAYAESCAAIGLVFFAHRMLQATGDGRYADVMERALYNGILSGVSLDGTRFFYVNLLERTASQLTGDRHDRDLPTRQGWFGCACCPPNIARLLASLGQYVYSQADVELYVHLYVGGTARMSVAGHEVVVSQETDYPWDGLVRLRVRPEVAMRLALNLRIPGWCTKVDLSVDGRAVDVAECAHKGYVRVERKWSGDEVVELCMAMPVQRMYSHPDVKHDVGRVALQRGPMVYCLEAVDNPVEMHRIVLPRDAQLSARHESQLLGGVTVITGEALLADDTDWQETLYRSRPPRYRTVNIKAIPYCVWDNREVGPMAVWLREC